MSELNLTGWRNTCGFNIESAEATSHAYADKHRQMQNQLNEIDERIAKLAELYEKADSQDRKDQITQAHNFCKSYQRPVLQSAVLETERMAQLWQKRADELKARRKVTK